VRASKYGKQQRTETEVELDPLLVAVGTVVSGQVLAQVGSWLRMRWLVRNQRAGRGLNDQHSQTSIMCPPCGCSWAVVRTTALATSKGVSKGESE
jgi:hypothetical protein